MGFSCKILLLYDLTRVRSVDREPIVYNENEPTRVQTCDEVTSLTRRNQHRAKALYWKSGGRKKVLVMLGYDSIQQMLSI